MSQENQIEALIVLCSSLKSQIKILTKKVEALSAAQTTSENSNCSKDIKEIQDEITDLVDFQIEESAKSSKELDLVDKAMDRLFKRTNDLRSNQMKLESKVKVLSASQAMSVSVAKQPQFARSNASRRLRPEQFRQPRARICYNCRQTGHFAKYCVKPNPRSPLSAEIIPKPTSILKSKQPEQNLNPSLCRNQQIQTQKPQWNLVQP